MDDIREWLNGKRDISAGLELLAKYDGHNKLLQEKSTQSDSFRKKLFFALLAVLNADTPQEQPAKSPQKPKLPLPSPAPATPQPDNDIAAAAKREADKLYKQMMNRRANLFALCPQEQEHSENDDLKVAERLKLAKEVHELQGKVDAAYEAYRHAQKHGRLPSSPAPVKENVNPVLLYQKITNLRKAIWRWDKKPDSPKRTQELADKNALLEELIKQYNNVTGRS